MLIDVESGHQALGAPAGFEDYADSSKAGPRFWDSHKYKNQ